MRFHTGGLATVLAAFALAICGGVLAQDRPPPQAAPATSAPSPESSTLAPGQPIPAATLEAFVDGVAAQAMARDHIAGAAVAVVQNGQVVLKKGYGVDRLSPDRAVDPDRTLFRLGGMTRVFTWVALMREIEAGRIRLDAPVNLYLPLKAQVHDQGYKRPVTIRDLLAHTEGFEDRAYGQLIEKNPQRIRTLETYLRQERPGRVRGAGDVPTVSSFGAALAGEALVQVTGKTMQDLTEGEITGPLGLRRTTLREPYPARPDLPPPMDPALARDVSRGFGWSRAGYEVRPFEYTTQAAPSMAASASAGDMARYMLAVLADGALDGATVYSPAIARQFRTPLRTAAPGAGSWDYGIMEFALPGGFKGYGHTGQTLSFRTEMVTVPQLGLGVFVASNSDTGGAFARELPQRIIERFYTPGGGPPPAASSWLGENASAFTGSYVTSRRAYYGLEGFLGRLRAEQKVQLSSDGFLVTPGPDGPRRWTPD
ncbi:MAG: serine hydrolase domain-containing protein, partial [Caulobacteraceae bacterium]